MLGKCYEIIELTQRSDEWLQFRKNGVGASDLPIIMGQIDGKNMYTLWLEKTGRVPNDATNSLIERGNLLEPLGRSIAEAHLGVLLPAVTLRSLENHWAIASLDGFDEQTGDLIEIKVPHPTTFDRVRKSRDLEPKYVYQCQWQMYVSGASRVLIVFCQENDHFFTEVERDDDLIDLLKKAASEFFYYVSNGVEPPTPVSQKKLNLDPEWVTVCEPYCELNAKILEMQKKLKEMREGVLSFCDGASMENDYLSVVYSPPKPKIDYEALIEELQVSQGLIDKHTKLADGSVRITTKKLAAS